MSDQQKFHGFVSGVDGDGSLRDTNVHTVFDSVDDSGSVASDVSEMLEFAKGSQLVRKILASMGVVFVLAFIYSTGFIPMPFGIGFSEKPVVLESGDVPCLKGEQVRPVDLSSVSVNVLNSTEKSGLATATAKKLKEKGVDVKFVGNVDTRFEGAVKIQANKKNIVKAYSVALLFPSSTIIYRENLKDIEIILGTGFSDVVNDEQFKSLQSGFLKNLKGCVNQ